MIIEKLRGCCLLLLYLSESHLQLLDQYPLLEPREAKEIRKKQRINGKQPTREPALKGYENDCRVVMSHCFLPDSLFDSMLDEVPLNINWSFDLLQ